MRCCLSNICGPTAPIQCCPWWCNLIPAITTLAISVIAIVLVFVYKKDRNFTIPPGICVLTSAHFVCLSVNTKHLKSFSQNNAKLSLETKNLQSTTAQLMQVKNEQEVNLAATKAEVAVLTRNNEQHTQLVAHQKRQLQDLQDNIERLKKGMQEQEERNKVLCELNRAQLEKYKEIACALGQNGECFAQHLKQFSETIDHFDQHQLNQKKLVGYLTTLHNMLFSDETIQKRQAEILSCEESLKRLSEEIHKKQEDVKNLNIEIKALETINNRLADNVAKLGKHVSTLITQNQSEESQ